MLKIGSKSNLDTEYVCKISLLDDSEMTCEFRVRIKKFIFGVRLTCNQQLGSILLAISSYSFIDKKNYLNIKKQQS